MKEIKLTRGQVALVDDSDFDLLNQWKWQALKNKWGFYATRAEHYRVDGVKKSRFFYMHRVILGAPKNSLVDHIDHNGLNNQRNNIRLATGSQNGANARSRKNSKSKYLGVFWERSLKKWRVQIQKDKKKKHIGVYTDETEAAVAYNKVAAEWHGEFANLNVV